MINEKYKYKYNPTRPTRPGLTIKENLMANNIDDLTAVKLLQMPMREYKQYLNGSTPITEEFAAKINAICPELEIQFILNLETQYRSFLDKQLDKLILIY